MQQVERDQVRRVLHREVEHLAGAGVEPALQQREAHPPPVGCPHDQLAIDHGASGQGTAGQPHNLRKVAGQVAALPGLQGHAAVLVPEQQDAPAVPLRFVSAAARTRCRFGQRGDRAGQHGLQRRA